MRPLLKVITEIVPPSKRKNINDTLTRLAVSTCISGSEAQDQGPSTDHMLSRVPISASSSNPPINSFPSILKHFFQQDSWKTPHSIAAILILKNNSHSHMLSMNIQDVCHPLQLLVGRC